MKRSAFVTALAALIAFCGAAGAQDYPNKPVRFIVPYAVGGAAELFARTIAQRMSVTLGQQVYIDSRPGANGIIGTEVAAKSPPDGYTLYMGNTGPLAINPALYQKLPYDPIADFAPISQGTLYPYILIGSSALKATTLPELIALAKSRPGELSYASAGQGSSPHLAGELFAHMAGVKLVHVPYKGSAPALNDVIGGQVPLMFNTISTSLPHIKSGKLRAFAITGKQRSPLLPDVPTMEEMGLTGYDVTSWQGVLAPAGTPRPIIDKLNRAVVEALQSKDVIAVLSGQGDVELVSGTPEDFARLIKSDLSMYTKLTKDTGIRLE